MTSNHLSPQTHTNLAIEINFAELQAKIRTGANRPAIQQEAEKALAAVQGQWSPAITMRWCDVKAGDDICTLLAAGDEEVRLHLGHSSRFLQPATMVLVAGYTAGPGLEERIAAANQDQDYLRAYFIDLIGLLVLEKTGNLAIAAAEESATARGWGVSPFLSPGSVHGWDIAEQAQLCRLLPLAEIGVTCREDGVLTPFKSLSCLIGIGKEYQSSTVGTTCEVCTRRHNCEMRQNG